MNLVLSVHQYAQVGKFEDLLLVGGKIPAEGFRVQADQLDRDPLDVRLADVAHAGRPRVGRL